MDKIIPFDYQIECLEAIHKARERGANKAFVVMASGLGKTITTALDVKALEQFFDRKARVLFLCHKNEILEQAAEAYDLVHGNERTTGLFHGGDRGGHRADFVFASLQTMAKRHRYFDQDEFDYVVVDESHHASADTFEKVIRYWRPKFLLGVTATPERIDKQNVREFFGNEVYHLPLETALVRNLLTPVDYRLMTDEISLEEILRLNGERGLNLRLLNRHIFVPKRDEEIARIIKENMTKLESPRTIIFCSSVTHAERIAKLFDGALALHSKINRRERSIRLELFRQGVVSVVTSVDVFNEGVDVPQANLIVFLRSTASPAVFLQQLGRGLRKSKNKQQVVVLDFAGNCERIRTVQKLQQAVQNEWEGLCGRGMLANDRAPRQVFTLNDEGFAFSETVLKVLDIVRRLYEKEIYATWQEASVASLALGIKSERQYRAHYHCDPKLPSTPQVYYPDYPGGGVFFRTGRKMRTGSKGICRTWQEASKIVIALGINSGREYKTRYKENPALHSCPDQKYEDFPGWRIFLGKEEYYKTWQQASEACRNLGIASSSDYVKRRKEDIRLPSIPKDFFEDFPGWDVFLCRNLQSAQYYTTWQEASAVVVAMGIRTVREYKLRYKEDSRLVCEVLRHYKDLSSWDVFFGKPLPYTTIEEASKAAISCGIKTSKQYRSSVNHTDPRLPAHPERFPDFPGWDVFLGRV